MFHVPAHKNPAAPAAQIHPQFEDELEESLAAYHAYVGDLEGWAEAGGYSAGLAKPVWREPAGSGADWEDIPY